MKQMEQIRKIIASCASKDEARPALCGVYFDNGAWVAVDGHRMAWSEETLTTDKPVSGTLYDASSFERGYLAPIKDFGTFPNWRPLIPADEKLKNKFNWEVPIFLKGAKPIWRIGTRNHIHFDAKRIYLETTDEHAEDAVTVNAGFFAVYAGSLLSVRWENNTTPIRVDFDNGVAKCSGVIMPMRR